MTPRNWIPIACAALLAPGLAPAARALPSYGTRVDTSCSANGWVPARPFNPEGGDPNDPTQASCGLCHTNASNPGGSLTAAGDQFRRSGHTDVTPFCSAPAANRPPVWEALAPQNATLGQAFQLQVRASDPEGGPLLLTVSNGPAGHSFSDAGDGRGTFSWTPAAAQLGSHTLSFHAADTGSPMAVADLDVVIAVGQAANLPPVLAPIGDRQLDPGATLAFSLSARDPENGALGFSVTGAPAGASLTGADFWWTPAAGQVGNHTLVFSVEDAGTPPLTDSETVVISVGTVNRPPLLAPIGERQVPLGSEAHIAVTASDPDGGAPALDCSGLPAGARFSDRGDGSGEIVWLPTAPERATPTCTARDTAVPPETDGETFGLAAVDPAAATAPQIDAAVWSGDHGGRLRVLGSLADAPAAATPERVASGAEPRRASVDLYALFADGRQALLGSTRVHRSGRFSARLSPFVAPCRVVAVSGDAASAALSVQGAAAGCEREPLLRASARLSCRSARLRVTGRRGPPGGAVIAADADSGAVLAEMPVSARGRFGFAGSAASAPRALSLRAESGGMSWALPDPLELRQGRSCSAGADEEGDAASTSRPGRSGSED